ncbi:hypothetical protein RQP46_008796 [Phenoliferia psychrophenolica]
MATFSSQPEELLSHILKLSTEGDPPWKQQLARFSFGLVSRACYHAAADAPIFYVAGLKQARALLSNLRREAKEMRRATSRSPTISFSRVTTIRHLSLVVENNEGGNIFPALLNRSPDLVRLDLDLTGMTGAPSRPAAVRASCVRLEVALGQLVGLRSLKISSSLLDGPALARILIPLKELRDLDLQPLMCSVPKEGFDSLLGRLSLPHLRNLRILVPDAFTESLLGNLAINSTAGIQHIDPRLFDTLATLPTLHTVKLVVETWRLETSHILIITSVVGLSTDILKSLAGSTAELGSLHLGAARTDEFNELLPLLPTVVNFSWTPERQPIGENVNARDAVLKLLGAMTNVETLAIPLWTLDDDRRLGRGTLFCKGTEAQWDEWDRRRIDRAVFDVLATLPRLRAVEFTTRIGQLDQSDVIAFINSIPTLQTLSLVVKKKRGWTHEAIECVRAEGEEAGVVFTYKGDHDF